MPLPLRWQLSLPLAAALFLLLTAATLAQTWLAVDTAQSQIHRQLLGLAESLQLSTFPLTDGVLRQMRGLSGAEFLVLAPDGAARAGTLRPSPDAVAKIAGALPPLEAPGVRSLPAPLLVEARTYRAALLRRGTAASQERLLILFPQERYERIGLEAALPPLISGALAILVAVAVTVWTAAWVSQPIEALRADVERIAGGDYAVRPTPAAASELRRLAVSVRRMARQLAAQEQAIREQERLRTLHQIGAGLAHRLRNAATGCRLTLQLHRREISPEQAENVDIAISQLKQMDRQLERLLTLDAHAPGETNVDLSALVERVAEESRASAKHLGVRLEIKAEPGLVRRGQPERLEQVVASLLDNALQAVAADQAAGNAAPRVRLVLASTPEGGVTLCVSDNGPGPDGAISARMFEPFVTSKPEGTGLGLALAREIVKGHGGDLEWSRVEGETRFCCRL